MLTREIGLTAALSLITGIDKNSKVRPYKMSLGSGMIQSNPKVAGPDGEGGGIFKILGEEAVRQVVVTGFGNSCLRTLGNQDLL